MSTEEIQDLVTSTRNINLDRKPCEVYHGFGISDFIRMLAKYWSPKPFTSLPPMYVALVEKEIKTLLHDHILVEASHISLMTEPRWTKFFENLRRDAPRGTKMFNKALIMKISIAGLFNTKFDGQHEFYGTVRPNEPGCAGVLSRLVPKWVEEGKIPSWADDFAKIVFFLAEIPNAEVKEVEEIDDLSDIFAKTKMEEEEVEDDSSGDDTSDSNGNKYYDATRYFS